MVGLHERRKRRRRHRVLRRNPSKRNRKLRNGYRGGYIAVTTKALVDALASGSMLTVTPARTASYVLDLDGLGDAMKVGSQCIRAQN